MSGDLYVGLMSGTSLDGVDAALVEFGGQPPRILASTHRPFDEPLRAGLLALCAPGDNEIERAALLGNTLARTYASAVAGVLDLAHADAKSVRAVGCHGQTIRHHPDKGFTVQIGNAALLAELCGIAVVADFRSRDVAAGGQGAPLVPAFHAGVFASPSENRVILNLGGIANITWLPVQGPITGFDCGPANCLLDLWAARHLGQRFDADGAWGASGGVDAALLQRLLAEPYFSLPPPKSTGRELFNAAWLDGRVGREDARSVQATLIELTVVGVREAVRRFCPDAARLIVCGGGARNGALMRRLGACAAPMTVDSSDRHGIAPEHVEATAFAWLARMALEGRAAGIPSVTGCRGARILGALHRA